MWALAGERHSTSFFGRTGAARREILGEIGPSLCVSCGGAFYSYSVGTWRSKGKNGTYLMTVPVWSYLCPSCGRPFVIRSEKDQPLPASALVHDLNLYDLDAGEGKCSACGLKVRWEVASLTLTFTNHYELKTPQLNELVDGQDQRIEDVTECDDLGPGFRTAFTKVLNALSDAMEKGTPQVVVTFDLNHETKELTCHIWEYRLRKEDLW